MNTILRPLLTMLFTLAAVLCPSSFVRASFIEDLSIAQMTARATIVVHGTVAQVDTGWDESAIRIYTSTRIRVISYLTGQGPEVVTVRQVGGRVGDTELWVEGQPRFFVGEQVVVFLSPDGAGTPDTWNVVAMAAGKFTVTTDGVTGELVLSRDLQALNRIRIDTDGVRPAPRSNRVARPLLLRELVQEVQQTIRQGGPR